MHVNACVTGLQIFLRKKKFSPILYISFSLDVGLRDVRAVDFDVDLSVILPLLLLSVERPSVADQVKRQQEA